MDTKKYIPERVKNDLGSYFVKGFDDLYAHGAKVQDEVLDEIIELVKDSAYARDHGFVGVSSKEEFLAKAPVSEYADYVDYVARDMEGEGNQLSSLPTDHYLMSTGRGDFAGKYYIETRVGAIARQTSIDLYQMGIVHNEPVLREPGFKTMPVVNPTSIPVAHNGKEVRRTSSQAGKALWENGGDVFIFPYEFLEVQMSESDRNYMYALYALAEKNLVQTNCNNLDAFGDFLDSIEANAAQMIEDIRTGHFSVGIADEDRALLEGVFQPNPARADELAALLKETGKFDFNEVWPRFRLATGWIGGSVGCFSHDVMDRLPSRMRYYNTPYGCTEIMIAATSDPGSDVGPLNVFGGFFEFLPLDGGDPVEMRDLQVGKLYEVMVTTYSGLCRYNLHDIIRVDGFRGETACIEFRGRAAEVIKVNDTSLYGFEFCDLVLGVLDSEDAIASVFQAFVENGAQGEELSVVVEFYREPTDRVAFAAKLKAAMEQVGIASGKVYVVCKGYRRNLYLSLMQLGLIVQSMKLPVVAAKLPDEAETEVVL